ncbi:MAG: Stk1 family PASTA domain-containing Ser/Thr kinase [Lachnospiraceae bacterium]
MIKAGMIIGERYEIIGKVGSGGMADVFKAKDLKLNRFVAIKILKPEFREDTTFVRKFKTEAQSAAGLTHPNIVNVYDVGEDNGTHYIVMELVEGITLKEYISKKHKLSVKEATSIAIQVSLGLQEAHSHGIIHRDIKPQNIIISTEGKVKVADFGIARAASANTISSNVMGSVHYSSPEQVRGGYSDEKSDIYSLGITLYEMVTGVVPFDGDTTVAIAIKHLQDEMELPSTYTPDLPHSLEQIIIKCTTKSVDRRYQTTSELIEDLKRSLMDPEGDFVSMVPLSNMSPTVMISGGELEQIKNSARTTPKKDSDLNEIDTSYSDEEEQEEEDEDEEEEETGGINRKLEKAMTIGGFIIGAIIICILLYFIAQAAGLIGSGSSNSDSDANATETQGTTEQVEVPSIVGLTEESAKTTLNDLGLGLKFTEEEYSDTIEAGLISSQETAAGTLVDTATTINYKLSKGPAQTVVPEVAGMSQGEAEQILNELGLVVSTSKEFSDTVTEGNVIASDPTAGTTVAVGSAITIAISMGEQYESFSVPNVVGLAQADAKTQLAALDVTVTSEYSDTVAAGVVIAQSIPADTRVDKGSAITISVSSGPQATTAPTATAEPVDSNEIWKCTQTIDTPTDYAGGQVRLELVQVVNGATVTTIVLDGGDITFPYQLNITGAAGVTSGDLYVSELVGEDYTSLGHYPITFSKVES